MVPQPSNLTGLLFWLPTCSTNSTPTPTPITLELSTPRIALPILNAGLQTQQKIPSETRRLLFPHPGLSPADHAHQTQATDLQQGPLTPYQALSPGEPARPTTMAGPLLSPCVCSFNSNPCPVESLAPGCALAHPLGSQVLGSKGSEDDPGCPRELPMRDHRAG